MKAVMSDKLREIISDPKKSEELRKGISKLNANSEHGDKAAQVSIGGHNYKIEFVSQKPKSK